ISPRASPMAIAWTRLRARNLRTALRTYVRTVSTDRPSRAPIASAVCPCATRPITSRSRCESWGTWAVERCDVGDEVEGGRDVAGSADDLEPAVAKQGRQRDPDGLVILRDDHPRHAPRRDDTRTTLSRSTQIPHVAGQVGRDGVAGRRPGLSWLAPWRRTPRSSSASSR